jgi:hypothetical protein
MDHIGIDVRKRDSQVYILAEANPHRNRALRRRARDPAPRPDSDRALDRRECVARCLEAQA